MRVVTSPAGRPAGTRAAADWAVTRDAWLVTAVPALPTDVATDGMPVTTPREFVSVRYDVKPLV